MKVTMLDVANKAGVSKATVSRVLNGKNIVRPDVVKRVFDAIETTGYRPNILARNLSAKKSNFIGLVISNDLFDGPYFSSLMHHAASTCEATSHQLVMTDGKHSKAEERSAINFLLDMRCAGIIIYPKYLDEQELADIISGTDTPIMVINRAIPQMPDNAITTNHYQSAVLMMEYIIGQGHKEVAIIRGKVGSASAQQRYQAYLDTLKNHGLMTSEALSVQGDWTIESGFNAAQQLLERGKPFSAVLACNDDMALGAIKAFHRAGLNIPQTISIAGFDNSNMCAYLSPSLSSVEVPMDKIIQRAIYKILGDTIKADSINTAGLVKIRDSIVKMRV